MHGRSLPTAFWRFLLFSVLALVATCPVEAALPRIAAGQPCALASEAALDPFRLLTHPDIFGCARAPTGIGRRFTYGLIKNLHLVTDPHDPWELRHEYDQARDEAVYVRYADGTMAKAPSDRMSARRTFSPGLVSYALPARPGTIVAVLVVIDGMQNQRGIAANSEFATGSAALDADIVALALYGLLAGTVIALFIYNFALWVALRYPFIFRYCQSSAAMLATGASWSGAIFLLLPRLDTTTQVSLTMFFTMLTVATSLRFLTAFIEPEFLPVWPRRFAAAAIALCLVSCLARLIDVSFAWVVVDRITYATIFATLGGMLAIAGTAAWRGSPSARVYLIAWTLPILITIARVLWGVGLIGGTSTLIAISPLIIMAVEALMSALAVTWRIGLLRDERDDLRHKASTDALTGLLNRRAFIERGLKIGADAIPRRLIVVDVDQFKLVNDRHGHQAGDGVLIRVAETLSATAPAGALVGRIGGEEFALLVNIEPVDALPDRLCRTVAESAGRDAIPVTISIGVADGSITDEDRWRQLYYAADQALYRSKHCGRNRVNHAPKAVAA